MNLKSKIRIHQKIENEFAILLVFKKFGILTKNTNLLSNDYLKIQNTSEHC